MGPEETEQKLWERIAAAFLRAPARPTSLETAAFVDKVMARLERPAPRPAPWAAAGWRWLIPVESLALALSLLLMLGQGVDYSEPAEGLLLMKGEASGLARIAALQVRPSPDELLALTLEDR